MIRLSFLLLLTFLAVSHAGLAAEPDPLHLAGSRVRLLAPQLGARKLAGAVVEVRADTLLFMADHQTTPTLVPIVSLTGLEVSRGMHSHVLAGAGLGFLAGAAIGGVIGYALVHENHYHPLWGAIGAVLAGGVGIGAGALVGSRQTERWEPLHLPIRIGILPGTDPIGLSVEVAIR